MEERENASLEQVYAARSTEDLSKAYSGWANAYDTETAALGYCLPFQITAWVARYVPTEAGVLLDAGCGTGLSGPYLAALGYKSVEGLDLSPAMLEIARKRGSYRDLKCAALGEALPWPDRAFSAFLSTGVFTKGHAPASSLDELVRITQTGGHAVFTVRDTLVESDGFRDVFSRLHAAGRWRQLEESMPFRAFAVGEPDVLVKAFVFEIT